MTCPDEAGNARKVKTSTTTLPGWRHRPRLRPRNGVGNWLGVPSTQNRQVDLPGDEFSDFGGRKDDFGGVK